MAVTFRDTIHGTLVPQNLLQAKNPITLTDSRRRCAIGHGGQADYLLPQLPLPKCYFTLEFTWFNTVEVMPYTEKTLLINGQAPVQQPIQLLDGDEVQIIDEDIDYRWVFREGSLDTLTSGFRERYNINQIISQGSFGIVYKAFDKATGFAVALKVFLKSNSPGPWTSVHDRQKRESREADILKCFNHPFIVKYRGTISDQPCHTIIVMDFVDGVPLKDIIEDKVEFIDEKRARLITAQLCMALKNVHDLGIAHRDVKPSNIMLMVHTNAVILVDFGLSKRCEGHNLTTFCGTIDYMAPEVKRRDYTRSVDCWSVGKTVSRMLIGATDNIYQTEEEPTKLYTGEPVRPSRQWHLDDDRASAYAQDFVGRLLCDAPNRMSMDDALKHPWLRDTVDDVKAALKSAILTLPANHDVVEEDFQLGA